MKQPLPVPGQVWRYTMAGCSMPITMRVDAVVKPDGAREHYVEWNNCGWMPHRYCDSLRRWNRRIKLWGAVCVAGQPTKSA